MADGVEKHIMTKGEPVCADAWVKTDNICRKTVEDLKRILSKLEEFRTYVIPADQNESKNSIEMLVICV